jgi:hypothetical protein
MLEPVSLLALELESYSDLVSRSHLRAARAAACDLRGRRVLHVSEAPTGDVSAHQLRWLVPLMRAVDIECDWRVLPEGHARTGAGEDDAALGLSIEACGGIDDGWDVVVVHGPRLAIVPRLIPQAARAWVWRPGAAGHRSRGHGERHAHVVSDVPTDDASVIPLGVDPRAAESMPLPSRGIARLLAAMGIDLARPLLLHSSRYGGMDGTLDSIDAYWRLKEEQSDLQLAIITGQARGHQSSALARADEDRDLHVFNGLGDMEVNALRTRAWVVVQTGRTLDWRLDVIESFWKARPVIVPGRGDGVEDLATRIQAILRASDIAQPVRSTGHDMVRARLLAPMVLSRWLVTLSGVLARTRRGRPRTASR